MQAINSCEETLEGGVEVSYSSKNCPKKLLINIVNLSFNKIFGNYN